MASVDVSRAPVTVSSLVDLLRRRADEQPEREAFSYLLDGESQEISLTHAELDRKARAIAAQLQSLDASGERALLLLPAGLDYLAAYFGCLYAGVTAVPFYVPRPDADPGTLQTVLEAPQAAFALTSTATQSTLQSLGSTVPALRALQWVDTDAVPGGMEREWRLPAVTADTLACLLYTSGSTSTPKGAMVSHGNLLALNEMFVRAWGLAPEGRMMLWSPLHFAMALYQASMALLAGCPLTIVPTAAFAERPMRWLHAISRTRTTTTGGPTFAYDLCARAVTAEDLETLDLSCWNMAWLGGEHVRADVLDRFVAAFAGAGFRRECLAPAYGMTEGGAAGGTSPSGPIFATFGGAALEQNRLVPAAMDDPGARTFLGHTLLRGAQTLAIVRPESLVRCAEDEVGEIWVAGPNVIPGYWNRPEENEASFRAYLAGGDDGPYYRTGDLGFVRGDQLFITGRLKEMIIIRGRNLYPQDIELTVEGSDPAVGVGGRAAFSVEMGDDERLVVVQEIDPSIQDPAGVIAAIRRAVAARHEVQAEVVVLIRPGTIPRTGTGKVQRRPCRQAFLEGRLDVVERSLLQEETSRERQTAYVPPRTPVETALAEIWAQVLQVEQVGIQDNFFELGGDSLDSMQMIAQAREAGLLLTVEQLVDHQTFAELSAILTAGTAASVQAEQGLVTGPVPLTPTQHYFFDDVPEHHEWYGLPYFSEIPGELDPELLREAVLRLLPHHDALRMRFTREGERWTQWNAAEEEHEVFTAIDLTGLSGDELEARAREGIWKVRSAIDLAHGPLISVAYLHGRADGPNLLAVRMHHLVMDAFSMSVWFEDLETAYQQLARGEAVRLPAKTTSFKAWAERLETYGAREEMTAEAAYWLTDARKTVVPLPVDFHGDSGTDGMSRQVRVALEREETQRLLRTVSATHGAEAIDALLAALTVGIGELTGERSLLITLLTHGRSALFGDRDIDLSRTMGWLTSMFPMLLTLDPAMTPAEGLRAVKEQMRAIPNRGLGFGILRYLSPHEELREQLRSLPQPEVSLNHTGQIDPFAGRPAGSPFAGAKQLRRRGQMGGEASRPLTVWSQIHAQQLELAFQYREDLHREATIERVARSSLDWLRQLIASAPDRS